MFISCFTCEVRPAYPDERIGRRGVRPAREERRLLSIEFLYRTRSRRSKDIMELVLKTNLQVMVIVTSLKNFGLVYSRWAQ